MSGLSAARRKADVADRAYQPDHERFARRSSRRVAAMSAQARGRIARALWYAHRLAAMSPAEIGHRVVEQGRRRRLRRHEPAFHVADGPLPVFPGVRERLLALPGEAVPLAAWEKLFRATAQGAYSALGTDWPPGGDPREVWHVDPVSGQVWPMDAFCFAIRYRDAKSIGDIKYVWERNRLQHLQPIAAYAARTGDPDAAALCRREIAGWIAANPPWRGVNWASGIELALRVVSLITVVTLLGPAAFPPAEARALQSCLAAHGYWLERFPSRHSSANNHLVAEAAGLFLLGTLAPHLPHAAAWRRYGRRTLEQEIARQIHPDGVGAEQSPTYTAFSLEWWLLAAAVARSAQLPFAPAYDERLRAAGLFLRWMLDGNDGHPRIGDDDEGRVIHSPLADGAYVPAILQATASATAAGEILPSGTYPHLWQAFHPALPERIAAPTGLRTFDEGGYSVVRERVAGNELLLAFDHGPLGYLSIAAHGHADALAIWLHLAGRPVLVDAGTFLYHSGEAWRDHFRGTAAHNTLLVDGADSSRIVGPFNWSRKARARLLASSWSEEGWRLEAEHDGFRAAHGVVHRRVVARAGEATLEIVDSLVGSGEAHAVEAGFLLHPDLSVSDLGGGAFLVRDGARDLLKIASAGPLEGAIERGRLSPRRGWYSPHFGSRQPASRIAFAGRLAPGQQSATTLRLHPA